MAVQVSEFKCIASIVKNNNCLEKESHSTEGSVLVGSHFITWSFWSLYVICLSLFTIPFLDTQLDLHQLPIRGPCSSFLGCGDCWIESSQGPIDEFGEMLLSLSVFPITPDLFPLPCIPWLQLPLLLQLNLWFITKSWFCYVINTPPWEMEGHGLLNSVEKQMLERFSCLIAKKRTVTKLRSPHLSSLVRIWLFTDCPLRSRHNC